MNDVLVPRFLAVSVVTYAELRAGVLSAKDHETRSKRLATLERIPRDSVVPIDLAVAEEWAALRLRLRDSERSMKVNDSWIAATAIAIGVPVVTQDADFDGVPGLAAIRV